MDCGVFARLHERKDEHKRTNGKEQKEQKTSKKVDSISLKTEKQARLSGCGGGARLPQTEAPEFVKARPQKLELKHDIIQKNLL